MKTIHDARQVLELRIWAGMLAVLLLASAEFWMASRLGHKYGQVTSQPVVQVPAIGDWFVPR